MEPNFPRSLAVALALLVLPTDARAATAEALESIEREIGIAEGAAVRLEARLAIEEPDRNTATLMARVNALIEGWVRERPAQWLWVHNRWPD